MEGKKVLAWNAMVLTLVMSLVVASARRPVLGLPMLGVKAKPRGEPTCCNNCSCDPVEGYMCTCDDSMQDYCSDGCYECDCSRGYCFCRDQLDSCPGPCDDDYPIDRSPREPAMPKPQTDG